MRATKIGRKATPETKLKMSLSKKGKKLPHIDFAVQRHKETFGKRVIMLNLESNYIQEFYLIADALRFLNKPLKSSQISNCCKNKRKTAWGYKWMYKEDYLKAIENKTYK